MKASALKDLGSRVGWTAAQALVGAVAAGPLVDALKLPSSYKPVAVLVVASMLSAIKSFVASKVGDPNTVTFAAAPPAPVAPAVWPPAMTTLPGGPAGGQQIPTVTSNPTAGVQLPAPSTSTTEIINGEQAAQGNLE